MPCSGLIAAVAAVSEFVQATYRAQEGMLDK
jgi:hypothetical protein